MLNSTILDVALGLCSLYILLSLTCSAINEWIAHALSLRARDLERGIAKLLGNDPKLINAFWNHHLVASVQDSGDKPSYLSAQMFSNVLVDVVGGRALLPRATLEAMQPQKLQNALLVLYDRAAGDIGTFRANVEAWFNDAMDRVTGWYKRRTQLILAVLGLAIAGTFNVDSIAVTKRLFVSPALRAAVVDDAAQARTTVGKPANSASEATRIKALGDELGKISLIAGWSGPRPGDFWDWLVRVAGWLLTALAVSFGAPFWFDLLGRVSNLRSAGAKPKDATK